MYFTWRSNTHATPRGHGDRDGEGDEPHAQQPHPRGQACALSAHPRRTYAATTKASTDATHANAAGAG
jgi:hypothetical protein